MAHVLLIGAAATSHLHDALSVSYVAGSALAASLSAGPCFAMKLIGEDAVTKWASAISGKVGIAGSSDGGCY